MSADSTFDLAEYSKEDLLQLQKDVEKAIKSYDARKLAEAKAAAEAALKEHGFSLSDVLASGGVSKTGKPKGIAKYADPKDPSLTWTGRGRKPNWVVAHLEAGGQMNDLAI